MLSQINKNNYKLIFLIKKCKKFYQIKMIESKKYRINKCKLYLKILGKKIIKYKTKLIILKISLKIIKKKYLLVFINLIKKKYRKTKIFKKNKPKILMTY